MKKLLFAFVTFFAVLSFIGCASNKIYYYGDYSKTLYHHKKDQNEESLNNHKQELEEIITKSKEKNLPIPPGIQAELGFIYLQANDSKTAITLFEEESKLYPESSHLMARLIQNVQARSKDSASISTDTSSPAVANTNSK